MKQSWWRKLFRRAEPAVGAPGTALSADRPISPPPLSKETLRRLVEGIFDTHDEELSCDECFELVDRFAEMVLAGREPAEAMPLVQDHLNHCLCCREEFEALLQALQGVADSQR